MAPTPAPTVDQGRRRRSATRLWPAGVNGIPYPPQPPAPLEYPCPECGAIFSRNTQMMFHYRCHVYPRCRYKFNYECLMCFLKFENAPQLGRHYNLKHRGSGTGGQEMRWKCPMCEKIFTVSASLKEHLLGMHLNLRRFKCQICSRRFARKCHMQQHVLNMH